MSALTVLFSMSNNSNSTFLSVFQARLMFSGSRRTSSFDTSRRRLLSPARESFR